MAELKYKRILLKVSGEGFSGTGGFGLTNEGLEVLAGQITELVQIGVQTAVVVGAGNFIRGKTLSEETAVHRVTADHMGMLATVMNAVALSDMLETQGTPTRVLSAIEMSKICELFIRRRAIRHLEKNRVIIMAGGTGNPFFTTDTCAALRASETGADVLIKATKVDGVYSTDPMLDANAKKYDKLSYLEVLQNDLKIMDHTAITMCRENNIDIIVCNLTKPGTIARIACGEKIGTLITA